MAKKKRIEELGLDPVLLERDRQRALKQWREHREKLLAQRKTLAAKNER